MDENVPQDRNRHPCLGVVDSDTGETRVLKSIDFSGLPLIPVAIHVYDSDLIDWVKGQQAIVEASSDLTVSFGDVERLLADNYWKRMKPYLHASAKPKYICKNTDIDANETDADWYVWKYTDADIPQIEGPRIGAVNTEGVVDALGWNV